MKGVNLPWALAFIAITILTWGLYVPAIHKATTLLSSSLRAFLMVGGAYFLVAVLIPSVLLFGLNTDPTVKPNQTPNWQQHAMLWGLFAGILGAVGALGVIFANANAGKMAPLLVAPLVFAGAPIVNTFASLYVFNKVKALPDWRFMLGLVLAAAGMAMIVVFKPSDATAAPGVSPPAQAPASSGH